MRTSFPLLFLPTQIQIRGFITKSNTYAPTKLCKQLLPYYPLQGFKK